MTFSVLLSIVSSCSFSILPKYALFVYRISKIVKCTILTPTPTHTLIHSCSNTHRTPLKYRDHIDPSRRFTFTQLECSIDTEHFANCLTLFTAWLFYPARHSSPKRTYFNRFTCAHNAIKCSPSLFFLGFSEKTISIQFLRLGKSLQSAKNDRRAGGGHFSGKVSSLERAHTISHTNEMNGLPMCQCILCGMTP